MWNFFTNNPRGYIHYGIRVLGFWDQEFTKKHLQQNAKIWYIVMNLEICLQLHVKKNRIMILLTNILQQPKKREKLINVNLHIYVPTNLPNLELHIP